MNTESFRSQILSKLEDEQDRLKTEWTLAKETPTRHFYIDNLLSDELANLISDAFSKEKEKFIVRDTFRERKRTYAKLTGCASILSEITNAFQWPEVIEAISKITDIDGLEADPRLYAGGLSMMYKGDFLNPHIDNSHDGNRKRYRRLNLLYYVSPDWTLDAGGNFELWDDKVLKPTTIVSKFNRLVVMETNDSSWHSVNAVTVESPRCCVSNYYFSKKSPNGNEYYHVTSFTGRPEQHGIRFLGVIDNFLRNTVSKIFKIGRGKDLIND